jgi:hypothetical protein
VAEKEVSLCPLRLKTLRKSQNRRTHHGTELLVLHSELESKVLERTASWMLVLEPGKSELILTLHQLMMPILPLLDALLA